MSFGKGSSDKSKNDTPPSSVGSGASVGSGKQAAFLGTGSKVEGRLVFNGPAVLGGEVEGEVQADSHLEISESAVIRAKIEGTEVVVKGTVEGDITATQKLELFRPGKILGNISCGSIHIEDGATFEGSCKMLGRSASGVKQTVVTESNELSTAASKLSGGAAGSAKSV